MPPEYTFPNDKLSEIIKKLANQQELDEEEFRLIESLIRFVINRFGLSPEEREDLGQECLKKLIEYCRKSEANQKKDSRVENWYSFLKRFFTNRCIDFVRAKDGGLATTSVENPDQFSNYSHTSYSAETLAIKHEIVGDVLSFIRSFPEREQRVFELCYVVGLKQREIANLLQLTEARVSQIKKYIEAQIRERMMSNIKNADVNFNYPPREIFKEVMRQYIGLSKIESGRR